MARALNCASVIYYKLLSSVRAQGFLEERDYKTLGLLKIVKDAKRPTQAAARELNRG
jgi:hypothetical protein